MGSFHPLTACSSELQLLSHGTYHVMITGTGAGYSRWKQVAVTRWREDSTCDNWRTFCYVRDLASGDYWSATHQPTLRPADRFDVAFEPGRASFRRRDGDIEVKTDISVAADVELDLRRVSIRNLAPHAGRGGWTWYTGSAGWLYRLILESLLGLSVEADLLRIAPCIPKDWKSFKIHYRYHDTTYDITVFQASSGEGQGITVNGIAVPAGGITLANDTLVHSIDVRIAQRSPAAERAA